MSESERRRKYRYDRVLIESARVLDPQFDDAVVYLTGSQIEMLRNMTQYLNRLDTYVSEQFLGYYLTPTVEDYDSILAIVADMEETLMGNPNTIWGYKDQYSTWLGGTKTGAGTHIKDTSAVPEGKLYVVQYMWLQNVTGARGPAYIQVNEGFAMYTLAYSPGLDQNEILSWTGNVPLKEGDYARAAMEDCLDNDAIKGGILGYEMDVP